MIKEAFGYFDKSNDLYSAVFFKAVEFNTDDERLNRSQSYELRVLIDGLNKLLASKKNCLTLESPFKEMGRRELLKVLL